MKVGPYTILEHSETVKPERFVVFCHRNGRLERAKHLGKRGGFLTYTEAVEAASRSHAALSASLPTNPDRLPQ